MDWKIGKLNFNFDTIVPSNEGLYNKFIKGINMLLRYKVSLVKSKDSTYSSFIELYENIHHATLLDFDRAYLLYQSSLAVKKIKGCTAECGVYKGGGSVIIANNCPQKTHYALDTFEGFPDIISNVDIHEKGSFSDVSMTEVSKLFSNYENIVTRKGTFSQSFKNMKDLVFSFVHIDADLYDSTIECCNFFYPRLVSGSIMLFDDYLVFDTPGVKKAVDDFFAEKNEVPIILPTAQAIVFKL